MNAVELVQTYFDEVYGARDVTAAGRYLADPCLRHEHGHCVEMSLEANTERISHFLELASDLTFDSAVLTGSGEFVTSCFNLMFGGGAISGIEVFRVVDNMIVETWNSTTQNGRWG